MTPTQSRTPHEVLKKATAKLYHISRCNFSKPSVSLSSLPVQDTLLPQCVCQFLCLCRVQRNCRSQVFPMSGFLQRLSESDSRALAQADTDSQAHRHVEQCGIY
eukprot:m.19421 g.19421  ORF g.19421 m.19421 type:complete len:104 (-) comp31010_c0_seq2:44-355(-)